MKLLNRDCDIIEIDLNTTTSELQLLTDLGFNIIEYTAKETIRLRYQEQQ